MAYNLVRFITLLLLDTLEGKLYENKILICAFPSMWNI